MSKFLAAYAKIVGMLEELPEATTVESYWADNFHATLNEIAGELNDDEVLSFKVDDSAIRSTGVHRNGQLMSKGRMVCDRAMLSARLKAVITYMQLQSSGEEKQKIIGFKG